MKRIAALCFSLLVVLSCAGTAFGATKQYTMPEIGGMTVEIPDDMIVVERKDLTGDAVIPPEIGVENLSDYIKKFKDYGIYLNAVSKDGKLDVNIASKESDTTKSVYNLSSLTDEEYKQFLEKMTPGEAEGLEASVTGYDHEQVKFFKMKLHVNDAQNGNMSEISYATVINGYSVSVDGVVEGTFTPEQEELLKQMADSVHFSEITEKPAAEPTEPMSIVPLLVLLGFIVLLIALWLFRKAARKRVVNQRKQLAEKLSEYRKEQVRLDKESAEKGVNRPDPACMFRNSTHYSEMTVRKFVRFHFLHRQIVMMVTYSLIALVLLGMAIWGQQELLMRVLLFAGGVFLIVWECRMPGKMFQRTMEPYRKTTCKVNEYNFREPDFRVSGIQSASVYPYFQITKAYESEGYFYLYFGDEQALYLEKEGFTQGTAAEFRTFLKQKLGSNFK